MKHIIKLIEDGAWERALEEFLQYVDKEHIRSHSPEGGELYILGATIMEHFEQYDSMFYFIEEGLKIDPCNYELYVLLGNYYYCIGNIDQTYLAYENAYYQSYIADHKEDCESIKSLIDELCLNNAIGIKNVSFVILSYNTLDYTTACIESIRNTCYKDCYEIVVVENGSSDGSVQWLRRQKDIILVENNENVGFPAGCNQGINAASPENDIFLLNSDALMMPGSLFWLRMGLYKDKSTGATGAITNYAGNDQMVKERFDKLEEYVEFSQRINIPLKNPYESKSYLVMFAMLIKRDVLNMVGMLDVRFTPGNFEDNDYGMRLHKAGFDCVLCHNCFIYHFGSKSFRKDEDKYYSIFKENSEKFKRKWGFSSYYYTQSRIDEIEMIKASSEDRISVLEIGCGLGGTLEKIRYLYPKADVHGIESEKQVAAIGSKRYDVILADIEAYQPDDRKYDYILFSDVLDNCGSPEKILSKMKNHLKVDGYVIANVSNAMNASVIHDLMTGNTINFDAELPKRPVRLFTLNEIKKIFIDTGFCIDNITFSILPEKSTSAFREFFDELLKVEGVADKSLFDVRQFIIRASLRHELLSN